MINPQEGAHNMTCHSYKGLIIYSFEMVLVLVLFK